MTNYNERLDKILKTSHHRIRTRILRDAEIYQSHIAQSEYDIKQALTSLIKELVAEAKPENDCMDCNGVVDFEQNLLKELEDK